MRNLSPQNLPNPLVTKRREMVKNLHKLKKTNKEIANILNIQERTVRDDLSFMKISCNYHENIEETNELKQFILGSILGDGYLSKIPNKNQNSSLSFAHSIKQKEYFNMKYNLLIKYNLAGKFQTNIIFDKREKWGKYCEKRTKSKRNKIFTKYRNLFYKNDIKTLDFLTLQDLDVFGLAIWFMDDGHTSNKTYSLATHAFLDSEREFLVNLLKTNFNINARVHGRKTIYIKRDSADIFFNLIKDFVPKSMKYKLHKEVLYKSDKLLETPKEDNQQPIISLND